MDKVTRVFTIRDKTAGELDDELIAQVDSIQKAGRRGLWKHENDIRRLLGQAQVTEAQTNAALKSYINADPPAPGANDMAVLRNAGGPARLLVFTAGITIGAVSGAAFTDKTFTVTGLLTSDVVLAVVFTDGLTPATISYMPLRVTAADTLAVRFSKIASGNVTPAAPQAITVLIASRSPCLRVFAWLEFSSGTGRRRPKSVST